MVVVKKQVPWCLTFLCLAAAIAHTMVMFGNMRMAAGLDDMGKSAGGWSKLGLAVAEALDQELDALLRNISFQLTLGLNKTIETQEMVDSLLSSMGSLSMDVAGEAAQNISLQQLKGHDAGDPMEVIIGFVTTALSQLPSFQNLLETLQDMLDQMKPALYQIAIWVDSFATKVQATVEIFGTTLDRVQTMFDSIMQQVHPGTGKNAAEMLFETFNLFDVTGTGTILVSDLQNCSTIYGIPALQGASAEALVSKYDSSGDGQLQYDEVGLMVEDPAIPGIMAAVLRAYAKRLSMVAGPIASARMRDEVASNVVKYVSLVAAKNITRVSWVVNRVTNGSLPLPFTADFLINLALQKDDTNALSVLDVGEIVVGFMLAMNNSHTMKAVDLLSTPEHWTSEGYDPDDQPGVVEIVTAWVISGPDSFSNYKAHKLSILQIEEGDALHFHGHQNGPHARRKNHHAPLVEESSRQFMKTAVNMPYAARLLSKQRMKTHMNHIRHSRHVRRLDLFDSDSKRILLDKLLRGAAFGDGAPIDAVTQAIRKGQPAVPATLEFAKWLAINISKSANNFQGMCFDYTGTTTGALDAFNTQIQGMVKKISGFIDIMKEYATPANIEKLDGLVSNFAVDALKDVFGIVQGKIKEILGKAAGESKSVLLQISNSSRSLPSGHPSRSLLNLVNPMSSGEGHSSLPLHLARRPHHLLDLEQQQLFKSIDVDEGLPEAVSGVWDQVSSLLTRLQAVLPQALSLLTFAREEVSQVSANMKSLFHTLEAKGVPIFAKAAALYASVWFAWYFVILTITLGILYYGFWASGFCGGPKPVETDYVPPATFAQRLLCCCRACFGCCGCHDSQFCFWSIIILFQLIVLVLFVLSLVFCVIGAVEIFIGSSCSMIYLLVDSSVCLDTIGQVSTFLKTFEVSGGEVPLSMVCEHYNLMTCKLIRYKLFSAAVSTMIGSFIACIFSFEMMFEIAIVHERAVWRRVFNQLEQEGEKGDKPQ